MDSSGPEPTYEIRVEAGKVVPLQDTANVAWHRREELPHQADPVLAMVAAQHRENFDLWHQEDKARDLQATDAEIVQVKHAIDAVNQRRNDLVEQIDRYLYDHLVLNESAPLHSETPGLIIDRLSILALKIFHTEEQIRREEVSEAHRAKNRDRLMLLISQRNDLAGCLDGLWEELAHGRRRFKVYRQMKMYNDPELNPVLYARAGH